MREALLYPSINLTDIRTIKTYLLLYDNLYRIVPESYKKRDDPDIKEFISQYGRIADISPDEYAIGTSLGFKKEFQKWSRTATIFNYEDDNHFFSWIRTEKLKKELQDEMISNGLLVRKGDWLEGRDDVIRFYMYYLANEISRSKKLTLISDKISSWTVEEFVRHHGDYFGDSPHKGQRLDPQNGLLLNVLIENFIPSNIEKISFKEIIDFQDNYRNERNKFLEIYERIQRDLDLTTSREMLENKIELCRDEIKKGVDAYKQALENIHRNSSWGALDRIATVSTIEGGPTIVEPFSHEELVWSSLGIFLGVYWVLNTKHDPNEKLNVEHPFSYLYYIKGENIHEVHSLNRKLTYKVNELVCD